MQLDSPLTKLLAVFAATAIVFILIWWFVSLYLGNRRKQFERRIRPQEDSDPTILLDDMLEARGSWWQRFRRDTSERLARTELGLEFVEALAIVLFSGVVLAAIVFFWRYEAEESWMAFPAFFLGAAIPLIFFLWKQRTWRIRMQDQLPDMLFLLARSLRAGMSIDQAIQVLGEHGVAPLSREFARMHRQLDLGLALNQVLHHSAERIRLTDFSVFASVLSLHRSTGGNLPIIMDRLAQTTRDHNQLRGHHRAATALSRFGITVISALGIVLVIYMWFGLRDLAIKWFDSTTGLTMFGIAMGLILLGLFLFFAMLRSESVE
jgi:tight adherence protein B